MGNRPIIKVPIDSEKLQGYLKNKKISIRKLAEQIDYSERQLRTFIKDGLMPDLVVRNISFYICEYDWLATTDSGGSFLLMPFTTNPIRYKPSPGHSDYFQRLINAEINLRNALIGMSEETPELLTKELCLAHVYILETIERAQKKGE